ncbi:septal ring lytic transglycosylase RlpA family protein [Algoriphagus namhaensis]|uniref:Probable endolytic peptidoglycan transglycosylase RlpA n=1 Tax=Algoriphagus namhaensis TaxID=915353 RepID=A0ABV8ANE6_9BACT
MKDFKHKSKKEFQLRYRLAKHPATEKRLPSGIGTFVEKRNPSVYFAMRVAFLFIFWVLLVFEGLAQQADSVLVQTGTASFYGRRFDGKMTANGEIFSMDSLTAAHKYLPFDTWVKVTRVDTRDTVWVRINDRLPRTSRRIIDLSRAAARQLKMIDKGLARVNLELRSTMEMNELYEFFEGEAPGTIRVRYFEEGIRFEKTPMVFDWE